MTRDEFVQAYMARSGIEGWRMEGVAVDLGEGVKKRVLPCHCGEDGCQGWAMAPDEQRFKSPLRP